MWFHRSHKGSFNGHFESVQQDAATKKAKVTCKCCSSQSQAKFQNADSKLKSKENYVFCFLFFKEKVIQFLTYGVLKVKKNTETVSKVCKITAVFTD